MLKSNNRCRNHPNITRLLETEIYERRRGMENMSQNTLADLIGVSRNCIQQMECHEHIPRAETVFDVMRALKFDEKESAAFLQKYLTAYYEDKAFQQEKKKELAGIV